MFNNREIATAFWAIIFFSWVLLKKDVGPSLLNSLFQLAKLSFKSKIILPFTFLFAYSFLVVFFLRELHIWKLSNLKETIYWFVFSAVITVSRIIIEENTERPIRKVIKELVTFTIVLEFILNTYVFKLTIELFFIPLIAILTVLNTFGTLKKEYRILEKFTSPLLAIIGIVMFAQAFIQIYHDWDKFARLGTLIDFILPPILTVSILPAIYPLLLYSSYDSLFTRVGIKLDSKEMKRYAKKLLILRCGFKVGRVKDMVKSRVNKLYNTASKEEIKDIILGENTTGETNG